MVSHGIFFCSTVLVSTQAGWEAACLGGKLRWLLVVDVHRRKIGTVTHTMSCIDLGRK